MLYGPRRLWFSNPNTTGVLPPKRFQQYYGSTGKEGFEKQCQGRERSAQRILHTDNPRKERRVTTGEANRLFIRGEVNSKGVSWQRHQKGHLPKVKWGLKWNKLKNGKSTEIRSDNCSKTSYLNLRGYATVGPCPQTLHLQRPPPSERGEGSSRNPEPPRRRENTALVVAPPAGQAQV